MIKEPSPELTSFTKMAAPIALNAFESLLSILGKARIKTT